MFYYFSAEYPCAIKVNGVYLGLIGLSVKNISSNQSSDFIEICPLNCAEPTINFLLDENFLNFPPPYVSITDLKGGYLIKFTKSYTGGDFKVIGQEKYNDLLVTVFNENGIKISLETQTDFLAEPIPTDCDTAHFYRPEFNKNLVAVSFSGNKTLLAVYDIQNKIKKVFFGLVDEFSFEDGFSTTENYLDIAKHRLTIKWKYEDCELKEEKRTLTRTENFNATELPKQVLPYAFLEEFMLKGEFDPYLCGAVLDNADSLSGFLGEYIGVMPPPSFRSPNEIGLIYHKKENCYLVDYFTFELTDGKISGIKKSD
ncbi:MAG: hypothetical protein IJX16_03265 [Clostridia bacterium]|nr:hypothetical protein [Clostridia bacterium]MBQ8426764.1 hypothetical protein [Clostridia bacterium]